MEQLEHVPIWAMTLTPCRGFSLGSRCLHLWRRPLRLRGPLRPLRLRRHRLAAWPLRGGHLARLWCRKKNGGVKYETKITGIAYFQWPRKRKVAVFFTFGLSPRRHWEKSWLDRWGKTPKLHQIGSNWRKETPQPSWKSLWWWFFPPPFLTRASLSHEEDH